MRVHLLGSFKASGTKVRSNEVQIQMYFTRVLLFLTTFYFYSLHLSTNICTFYFFHFLNRLVTFALTHFSRVIISSVRASKHPNDLNLKRNTW